MERPLNNNRFILTYPEVIKMSNNFLEFQGNVYLNVLVEARLETTLFWQWRPVVTSYVVGRLSHFFFSTGQFLFFSL